MPKYDHLPPMRDRKNPSYRYKELIDALGGPPAVRKLIEAYGYDPPSVAVIRGWSFRNSVPSRWSPLLMHKLSQDGVLRDVGVLFKEAEG